MTVPVQPKIYHIVHIDRLSSIIKDGYLWCDAKIIQHVLPGTSIGMSGIKQRRLQLTLASHPNLRVGDCVPFYFCPRSVMLYLIYKQNVEELTYRGGQGPIVHLEASLYDSVAWAQKNNQRWVFTLSNAGANYFEDRCDLANLNEIDWMAVQTDRWENKKEGKQAEFLMENKFPWHLIGRIGVHTEEIYRQVGHILPSNGHRPLVEIRSNWYY